MALTVKALIARLKKLDQGALVAWKNHDQDQTDIDGYVNRVGDADDVLLAARADEIAAFGKTKLVVLEP